jgi:hypothetical protein
VDDVPHWIKVGPDEKFKDFRKRVTESLVEGNNLLTTIKINFHSSVRRSKIPFNANDSDKVTEFISRQENAWPGTVMLTLQYQRNSADSKHALENPEDSGNFSYKGIPSTEFVPTATQTPIQQTEFTNFTCFPDSLFNEVSNISIRQGKLQKHVVTKKQEQLRDEYFMLDTNRLWYLSIKTWEISKQLSYIDLNEDTVAKMKNVSTSTFEITYNKSGRGGMLLKGRNKEEVDSWITDINNRKNGKSDNDEISAIEDSTVGAENKYSYRDVDKFSQICSFEGMLNNR